MSGKALVRRLLSTIAILLAAETNVLACQSGDEANYDTAKNALVVRALVSSVEREATAGSVCLNVTYEVREVFFGSYSGSVNVSMCTKRTDDSLPESEQQSIDEDAGIVVGAEVLVGLTSEPPLKGMNLLPNAAGAFRFLIYTCWGPLHVRHDQLPDEERSVFIEQIRTDMKSWQ
ncbi:hypothetical protein [Mesorhizobium sp. IMUNJ 23232]|uniref:hypothetical protein n=1 Tax=Mesorhizobium sp. IMUNJ 23232 TaxID=3376064 RepID=UPI0037BCA925